MFRVAAVSALLIAQLYAQDETTDEPVNTVEVDCDNSDVNDWTIAPIGKSTQFRLFDPCGDRELKIKVEGITEMDGETKTNNKVTTLSNNRGWEDNSGPGAVIEEDGSDVLYNKIEIDELKGSGSSLLLETRFYIELTNITDPDTNETITLQRNALKFDVSIAGWTMLQDTNNLELCIGLLTKKGGDAEQDEEDETTYTLDGFEIDNVQTAICNSTDGEESSIEVTINEGGNGNNQLELCYSFESCVGDIIYDPIIQIIDGAVTQSMMVSVAVIAIISLLV